MMRSHWILATLFVCIGAGRIISTYHVFNQTFDEPSHIACGMEWWDRGTYTIEALHPPLARVAAALLPYLSGVRSQGLPREERLEEGNLELETHNAYWSNLTLARIGILPFYFLACLVVWMWTTMAFGSRAALFAILLFTSLPMILAHSALATADIPVTATPSAALFCLVLWVERPGLRNTAFLGITLGLAVLSKFTVVLFFPACVAALLISKAFMGHVRAGTPMVVRKHFTSVMACVAIAFLVVWAGYRFSVAPMIEDGGPRGPEDQRTLVELLGKHHSLLKAAQTITHTPLPGMMMARGLVSVWEYNKKGNTANLFGMWRNTGWWYFFPVLLFFKTPLAFLILALGGLVLLIRTARTKSTLLQVAPGVFFFAILGASLFARIDVGLRHILPVFPLMAIVAAHAVETVCARPKSLYLKALISGLLLWLVISSALAHPDYLAYFNQAAFAHPEHIAVDSDLDWGQDLQRLSNRLRQLGVQQVYLEYFGSADVAKFNLPQIHTLSPYQEVEGWVAISVHSLELPAAAVEVRWPVRYALPPGFNGSVSAEGGPFSWLRAYPPVERVGRSIWLYHLDGLHGDCSLAPCRPPGK